ncbi:MAG: helix-turn-helix transcriptional regulator, partial [Saprospiraceae bacterium]|nr:helix-turn-helix transcriptional regulator [Saprospiraceae bacterium]
MSDFLQKLNEVTESCYRDEALKATNLHEHLRMSRSALHYKLKKHLDKSTAEFLTDFRITKAKELLLKSTESIKVIAFQVGFRDPNYFSRVFKKQ